MKVRLSMPVTTQPGPSRRAWLTAARASAGAMLVAVALTACSGGSPSSSVPSIFTPQPTPQGSSTQTGSSVRTPTVGGNTPTGTASARASTTHKATATHTATPKDSPTAKATTPRATATTPRATHKATPTAKATQRPHASHAATPVPSATFFPGAPETGGGGTAGLQDGLLFGIGGAAVLAGLGSLALRRRLARKHRPGRGTPADTDTDAPTHTAVR